MKRFALALSLCASLLVGLSLFLFPSTEAAENPLLTLLNLPAPPPLNPQVPVSGDSRQLDFYDKSRPPADNGPIEDLMDYWSRQSSGYAELGYNPKPSEKALDRILAEVEKDHSKVYGYLNVFRGSKKAAELVKEIYDRSSAGNEQQGNRAALKRWLTYNSSYFSSELAREAAKAHDAREYVDHQEEFLSLGRVDWERARPIVDRLYGGSGKVSRVLAQWALYRNALDNDSLDDIERYRNELKAVVEDKTATDGMRDLAFDALVKEKEWNGRDEWYYSLLADETLDDLRVNGQTYTGLTTAMIYTPAEKHVDKMIELTKSDNKTVRTAAVKNLLRRLNATNNPEIVRALLPWIIDPKWVRGDSDGGRAQVVNALQFVKIPESVPALIAALDEKIVVTPTSSNSMSNAKTGAGAMNAAVQPEVIRSQGWANNTAAVNASPMRSETVYPMRFRAVPALGHQEDPRAVPALRRILNETSQAYEKQNLVAALFKCHGFTIPEQVDALEQAAREGEAFQAAMAASNVATNTRMGWAYPATNAGINILLGAYIASMPDQPSNELTRGTVDRIVELDRTDPKTSRAMRRIVTRWLGPAINSLLMRDLKNNRVETDTVLRLLVLRKGLRETQQADVSDLRTGSAIALGLSACILEDTNDYDSILNGSSDVAKTAMLACARLIRAPLSIDKVAPLIHSKDKLLALAAERYLESEDSPEARRVVLSLHPNEALILGATTAFYPEREGSVSNNFASEELMSNNFLYALFGTISPYHASVRHRPYTRRYQQGVNEELEQRLRAEVKQAPELLGVYNLGENFIRIYKDKAVFSWETDPARYRERVLTTDEFERLKGILSHYKADEMPPYLACASETCQTRQLLMLGRNGGRRVFMMSASLPPFFAELDRAFEEMRAQPATIKYWASKEIAGLEVLFADDNLDAVTVWKGDDLRLLIADKAKASEIAAEMEEFAANLPEEEDSLDSESGYGQDPRIFKERLKRAYENYGWRSLSAGELGAVVPQPAQVEFIPSRDEFPVRTNQEAWKARVGATEIRADENGIYKISAGKLAKIQDGYYEGAVITPDGRWVVTSGYDDERGGQLVRINLQTKKQFVVQAGDFPIYRAIAWVPSVARVLVGPRYNEYDYGDSKSDGSPNIRYSFLDPETGRLTPATGDARPLAQQTFRSLQPSSNAFDYWVAIPGENETTIGIYNTRVFAVTPVLKVPKIKFDSMDMWVDEAGGKVYIVYEGQLVGVPIKVKG